MKAICYTKYVSPNSSTMHLRNNGIGFALETFIAMISGADKMGV